MHQGKSYHNLGWQRLYYQRLEHKSILMYKLLNGTTPDYLESRFVYRDNVNTYRLRSTENKLVLTQPQTEIILREVLHTAELKLWNNLSIDLSKDIKCLH